MSLRFGQQGTAGRKAMSFMSGLAMLLGAGVAAASSASPLPGLPSAFDLRRVDGTSYVTAVKSQSGGTCWTHGTMAAVESNLMRTGVWRQAGEVGEANLAEYHLDWWNAFNKNWNPDIANSAGLTVHQGGDYRIAAAYIGRGGGVVRDVDGQSYNSAPARHNASYHYYYVRDIEWMTAGANLENIAEVKQQIMDNGAMGTALAWSDSFYSSSKNSFYQPRTSTASPNHAVTIVGWDDAKVTQAPQPGAWLIKNSWGSSWGDGGYFWISYYDKVSGQHDQMGTVSFRNVEPMRYDRVYFHDFHGWRDTKVGVTEAVNAFVGQGTPEGASETMAAVSFYTAADNVTYTATIFGSFEDGELADELATQTGTIATKGFHTVDLDAPFALAKGQKFYVHLSLSAGGHAFDKTSDVPVLLGSDAKVIVESKASPNESWYRNAAGAWVDLTKDDRTANFAIKALTTF